MSYSFSENQWNEKYIEELNRTDFTDMTSSDFFASALDIDLARDNTLFLVIGSDSGLLLPYLTQQTLGRGSRVVVVEHDDVYPLVAKEYRGLLSPVDSDSAGIDKKISLHKHSNWCDEVFDGSEKPWLLGGVTKIVESNASATDYSNIYMPIVQSIKKAIEERIADISATLNRAVFTQMQFRNAADNHSPLKISTTFGAGKTAIVLGAGPSLDVHLEWIIANRDRLFILAVSRIAKKLLEKEIKPDLLMSVDPYEFSYEVCKSGLLWTDIPLVHNFHVSAKLVQQWQGPHFSLGKRLPWHDSRQLNGFIASAGPTVSHTAVFVASQLGFSQILMTGVDLCYSVSASTHADSSPEQMIQQMPSLCDAQVKTYSGRVAGTSVALKQCVDSLNDIGKLVNRHQPVLFNLSDEAALCDSITYKDIADVELPDNKPEFGNHACTEARLPTLEELDQLDSELKKARHSFSKMRKLCTAAKDCVKLMHAPDAGANAQKNSHKLTKIRKELEKDYPQFLEAIIYDNGAGFEKASTPTQFEDMSAEELVDWGCGYYNLIDDGARRMIDYIEDVSMRIALRRDEHKPEINVRELAKRWRADETPGRILLWRRLKWSNVKAQDRAWVQRAIGKFRSTLNEPSALVREALVGKNEDINNVMKSLVFLSTYQRADELQAIESRLSVNTWPYSALKPFTSALLLELQNDDTAALSQFQHAIDICSKQLEHDTNSLKSMQRLIEACLVRMTQCYISIKDYDSALATLGMLCEMLPSYVISYAKMLNTAGQTEFAIELLESYVQLYPTHKKAQFVLSKIKPTDIPAVAVEENPVYAEKVNDAMEAIMGGKPSQPA